MKESSTIDKFASQFSGISSKSTSLRETINVSKLVKKFITSLPRRFIHIIASIEQFLDLKTIGFNDVVRHLKAYEEHIQESEPTTNVSNFCSTKPTLLLDLENQVMVVEELVVGDVEDVEVVIKIPINKIEHNIK